MGEITDALRRAKLDDQSKEIFRDSVPDGLETPPRARDWGGPPLEVAPDEPLDLEIDPEEKRDEEPRRIEIPKTMTGFWIPRAVLVEPPVGGVECFRHFAVKVNRALEQRKQNAVLVTSALPEEGKTTVSCNMALAMASISGGRPTALVDLDLHRSAVSRVMGTVSKVGIEHVLSGDASLHEVRIETDLPSFDLYPVATPLHHTTRKAHELLAGPHFQTMIKQLSKHYDRIVFDGPPTLLVPDVALVANHVPACVLVTRRSVTRRSSYLELLSIIPRERLIGSFLNEESGLGRPHYAYYHEEDEE